MQRRDLHVVKRHVFASAEIQHRIATCIVRVRHDRRKVGCARHASQVDLVLRLAAGLEALDRVLPMHEDVLAGAADQDVIVTAELSLVKVVDGFPEPWRRTATANFNRSLPRPRRARSLQRASRAIPDGAC